MTEHEEAEPAADAAFAAGPPHGGAANGRG